AQARTLGVRFDVLSIEPIFEATLGVLAPVFAGLPPDATEENIQARCRGILLMALSNKLGSMLLSTGNKSEMAVGYATLYGDMAGELVAVRLSTGIKCEMAAGSAQLYGDMAGGVAPLKDCTRSRVYRLARDRTELGAAIPERVITRAPSAALRDNQKDSDSLPP